MIYCHLNSSCHFDDIVRLRLFKSLERVLQKSISKPSYLTMSKICHIFKTSTVKMYLVKQFLFNSLNNIQYKVLNYAYKYSQLKRNATKVTTQKAALINAEFSNSEPVL